MQLEINWEKSKYLLLKLGLRIICASCSAGPPYMAKFYNLLVFFSFGIVWSPTSLHILNREIPRFHSLAMWRKMRSFATLTALLYLFGHFCTICSVFLQENRLLQFFQCTSLSILFCIINTSKTSNFQCLHIISFCAQYLHCLIYRTLPRNVFPAELSFHFRIFCDRKISAFVLIYD